MLSIVGIYGCTKVLGPLTQSHLKPKVTVRLLQIDTVTLKVFMLKLCCSLKLLGAWHSY